MFKRNDRSGGKSFGKRDSGPVTMHKTSCANCGNSCEVPFKPNGKKPVLCRDCFQKDDNGGSRSNERSFDRPSYKSQDRSFDRPSRFDDNKPSYPATCGDCGARCTVPFKPMQGKPVKCKECFIPGDRPSSSGAGISAEQFEILNAKMDAILKAVGAYVSTPKRLTEKKPSKKIDLDGDEESEDEEEVEVKTEEAPKPAKKAWAKIKYTK